MSIPYVVPKAGEKAFNCPFCGAYSNQLWSGVYTAPFSSVSPVNAWAAAHCTHCKETSFWKNSSLVYPTRGSAPLPNRDMPADIATDYEEARQIVGASPRGAAALLRLAIQKLCEHLGEKGENINDDIGRLVQKGLPAQVQKALDSVRVIGNDSVHPGQIDLRDDPKIAVALFGLVNFITEKLISDPKEIDRLYGILPEAKRAAIEKRDGKNAAP